MKKKVLAVLLCTVLLVSVLAGCSSQNNSETAGEGKTNGSTDNATGQNEGEKYKIILITMDSTDQHWVAVDKGAKKAVEELGNIDYKWMAPDKKDDAQQIERINNAIADGADAIVIAATGPDAVTAALEEAKTNGIKIVYVDSPANTEAYATFATDNQAAGRTAGEQMIKALEAAGKKDGKVGIVNVNSATTSTVLREKGFREALEGKGYTLLPTQYGEGDAMKSQDIADNYITDGVVGIFGTNEGSTVGVGNAIKAYGQKDIVGVGFDKSDAILSLVKEGWLYCTIVQNPETMGYEGIKAAVKAIKGEKIDNPNVDTGVSVVSQDNVDSIQ
ncbi:ABC transporter substrate-binding protein [Mahella australiensis]|uniref:Monosaccharide ABC transporter substrate-binding protein, CUT2 family n=1 Tax=Mahella australiensis (strain DSM 15567 / CIP 107919 / 50-1 BON) TaxID=697281 RepID=F3ZZ84_MAHA5|nr:ABC transporter substrate-binding protein [Mahella australiensis]AEE97866.1 monosaccharide ABC transporter substrate-binding protein, CUT2 family [Mahella australiensis 50-1 BON]